MHWVNQENYNYAKKHHVLQLQIMHFSEKTPSETYIRARRTGPDRQLAHALIVMLTIRRDFVMLTRA